mgnify:CR=1 FL=1
MGQVFPLAVIICPGRSGITSGVNPAIRGANRQTLTEFVTQVQWHESTMAPYGAATVSFQLPRYLWLTEAMPVLGDWLLINDKPGEGGRALFWGVIVDSSTGIEADHGGAKRTLSFSCQAISWFDYGERMQFIAQAGITQTLSGLTSLRDYGNLMDIMGESVGGNTLGPDALLRRLLPFLWRVKLPESLTGKEVGMMVQTIDPFDDHQNKYGIGKKAGMATGMRARYRSRVGGFRYGGRMLEGFGGSVLGIHTLRQMKAYQNGSVLGLLLGTFAADPILCEMFPSLEDFGGEPFATDRPNPDMLGNRDFMGREMDPQSPNQKGPPPTSEWINEWRNSRYGQGAGVTELGQLLGRNPLLIHRQCPFRVEPIEELAATGVSDPAMIMKGMFKKKTWDLKRAFIVDAEDLVNINFRVADTDSINAVTIDHIVVQEAGVSMWQRAGLPIKFDNSVRDFGLRLAHVRWPYDPAHPRMFEIMGDSAPTVMKYFYTIAAQGFHNMYMASVFGHGTASMRFRPDIRHGEPIHLALPKDVPRIGEQAMIAYTDKVTHNVQVTPQGGVMARTHVEFSRALLNEELRSPLGRMQYYNTLELEAQNKKAKKESNP